jgi:hypothetical protein
MRHRSFALPAVFGLALLGSSAALAGGGGCATCYRETLRPAIYENVTVGAVVVRPAQTVVRTIAAEYRDVAEQVMVAPARKVWQVTHDGHGRRVGCWVMLPAQYSVQHRQVLVRPPQMVYEQIPALYAPRKRTVITGVEEASWEPVGGGFGSGIGVGVGVGIGARAGHHSGGGLGVGVGVGASSGYGYGAGVGVGVSSGFGHGGGYAY